MFELDVLFFLCTISFMLEGFKIFILFQVFWKFTLLYASEWFFLLFTSRVFPGSFHSWDLLLIVWKYFLVSLFDYFLSCFIHSFSEYIVSLMSNLLNFIYFFSFLCLKFPPIFSDVIIQCSNMSSKLFTLTIIVFSHIQFFFSICFLGDHRSNNFSLWKQ